MKPLKNYIIAVVIIIITVFVTLYLKRMYEVNKSFDLTGNEISYLSLDNYLYENPEVIIYLKDNDSDEFNEEFVDVINELSLSKQTIYINVTKLTSENKNDFYSKYCHDLKLHDKIFDTPNIILIRNREVEAVFNQSYPDLETRNISDFLNGWLNG